MTTSPTLNYDNIIDADGHVLEPLDTWEKYIDPPYRDRAIRVRTDGEGKEYLEIEGHPSKFFNIKTFTILGGMGRSSGQLNADLKEKTYVEAAPFGSMDAKERVALLDREGLRAAILYPSIGLTWECETEDFQLALAYARAYNRWIVDFCSEYKDRLIPIAHVSLADGHEAAKELERAVKAGCKGAFVAPFTITNKAHAHPDYDPFWAKAQELGVPVGIHPMAEHPTKRVYQRFKDMKWAEWYHNVLGGQGPQQAFFVLFQYGLFDRFPQVKVVVLESGAGWIGAALDRMDTTYETALGKSVPLKEKPSYYFKRQCWISGDPDEKALAHIVEYVGNDKFFWATDFPHFDHPGNYLEALQNLVTPLSPTARRNLLGDSVARVYGLD
ncbi:MAG TPA: amidohydrolase family protein [Candidatus Binatia bacterium]|nr:amidohydrolase family protein [Candidatus Binatia bacterium]